MTQKVTGIIEKYQPGSGIKPHKVWIDGIIYSEFKKELFDGVAINKEHTIEYVETDKGFRNVVSITPSIQTADELTLDRGSICGFIADCVDQVRTGLDGTGWELCNELNSSVRLQLTIEGQSVTVFVHDTNPTGTGNPE